MINLVITDEITNILRKSGMNAETITENLLFITALHLLESGKSSANIKTLKHRVNVLVIELD